MCSFAVWFVQNTVQSCIFIILSLWTEKLNEKQGDRIRFYLSKADTAGHESDRQVQSIIYFGQSLQMIVCGDAEWLHEAQMVKQVQPFLDLPNPSWTIQGYWKS